MKDYSYDAVHVNTERKHEITRQEAEKFVRDAEVSIERWNGRFINYYGEHGATYIDVEKKNIRTAFKAQEYDKNTRKFMEVVIDARNRR